MYFFGDKDLKEYKSYFILKPHIEGKFLFDEDRIHDEQDGNKIIISRGSHNRFQEISILWETNKIIREAKLDEDGSVSEETRELKEVNKALVWLSPSEDHFIYIFTSKNSTIPDIQNILKKYIGIPSSRVMFNNNFFINLINSDINNQAVTASFHNTEDSTSTYTISGDHIHSKDIDENIEKNLNNITQMSLLLYGIIKLKAYKNSKITIYNVKSIRDIEDTINLISNLLYQEVYYLE